MLRLLMGALLCVGACAVAQTAAPAHDAGGYAAPTAKLEHGRKIFVESSCHFCHGVDLTGALMGAADLMHDPLVGADNDGNFIGPVVLAGLPNLQTAMPKFPELTKSDISDLAGYVHYLRQQGRFKELTASTATGDVAAGKTYFAGSGGCSGCHTEADMRAAAKKYDRTSLRAHLLLPTGLAPKDGVANDAGDAAHRKLVENIAPADAANVSAYLETLR
jgi:mono/diheme cytochrome c family protein